MELRPYQKFCIDDVCALVHNRRLYVAPTGTGKGVIQKEIHKRLTNSVLITPSIEIAKNWGSPDWVMTPVMLRNRILRGEIEPPSVLLVDEAHHEIEENTVTKDLLTVCPNSKWYGFTATPFRGTPKGTHFLRQFWGEPVTILSIKEAVENGWLVLPKIEIVPLVDDEILELVNGEFKISSVESATQDRYQELSKLLGNFSGKSTILVLPSIQACLTFKQYHSNCNIVISETPDKERNITYQQLRDEKIPIVTVRVLNEGVDFPFLEVLIDARPTMSPVLWLQTVGRLTRPYKGIEKFYICTNRNFERHAYLFEGILPNDTIKQAQKAFGNLSLRSASRVIGLEGVGKFKPLPIYLASGEQGWFYNLYSSDGYQKDEYAIVFIPSRAKPMVFKRISQVVATGWSWGRWKKLDELPMELKGFATSPFKGKMTDKQRDWWRKSARHYGLDEKYEPNAREFSILPILVQTGTKL